MELHICHLYPSLLNMYGDVGNIRILKYRAEKRDISVFVHTLDVDDVPCFDEYDIVMLGGGQDSALNIVLESLSKQKDALKNYIENDGVFLACGTGYQILGESYISAKGETKKGLGLFQFTTEKSSERFVGNIAVKVGENVYVGFENHQGKTALCGMQPFGTVLHGYGNNGADQSEGIVYKNVLCSFLHGPILSKNPELADDILLKALKRKHDIIQLSQIDDSLEIAAREVMLARMNLNFQK